MACSCKKRKATRKSNVGKPPQDLNGIWPENPDYLKMGGGAVGGIVLDEALNWAFDGFMTDKTGRIIKTVAGLGAFVSMDDQTVKGTGAGLAATNLYAMWSKNNRTIGQEIIKAIAPDSTYAQNIAGQPLYLNRGKGTKVPQSKSRKVRMAA